MPDRGYSLQQAIVGAAAAVVVVDRKINKTSRAGDARLCTSDPPGSTPRD